LAKQSGTAYYLLGCIERDRHKNEEALITLKKADYILTQVAANPTKKIVIQ